MKNIICVQFGGPISQQDHSHWAKAGGEEEVIIVEIEIYEAGLKL